MRKNIEILLALFFVVIASYGQTPPTITSFSPSSGPVGTQVTISGTNFSTTTTNNIVFFGPIKATVVTATTTSLTVTVPTGANYSKITVLNLENSLMCDSLKPFMPTFSPTKANITAVDFNTKVDFSATGTNEKGIGLGDLNGDGKTDLVVVNQSDMLSFFINNSTSGSISSSSFPTRVDIATGTGTLPASVTLGDLDGDGKLDIVVPFRGTGKVAVLRNQYVSGTFDASSLDAIREFNTGSLPEMAAIGDLDADGKPELVVANYGSSSFSILKNTSTYTNNATNGIYFDTQTSYTIGTGKPVAVTIADMDVDGKPDVVVTDNTAFKVILSRNISTSGSISFQSVIAYTTGNNSLLRPVAVGDLNGDGKPDIAIPEYDPPKFTIFQNNSTVGSFSFATPVSFSTGAAGTVKPFYAAIGDLDGDGKPDVAIANSASASISVFRNLTTFQSPYTITTSSFPTTPANLTTGTAPLYLGISDMDGDGKSDLIATNLTSGTVSILRNDPKFSITLSSAVGTDTQVKCISTAITNITYTSLGGASAVFSGLPAGVTGSFNSSTGAITISGIPTVVGVFNYTITLTGTGTLGTITATGIITVNKNTVALTSGSGTDAQTVCINTPITSIQYATTGATGASFSGLPSGVTGSWANDVITISGTPTTATTYNYTVTLTGGCSSVTATGSVVVTANNTITRTSALGTDSQSKCVGSAITTITYSTTRATGATFSGLPPGVAGSWSANVVTISGTPTTGGIYNYTVTLTGGCGSISAIGVLYINNTIRLKSAIGTDNQSVCKSTAITSIQYDTTSATGATFSGLPTGVTGSWSANVVTISGTPTIAGIFTYTVTLTGGCTSTTTTATGTINVDNTITLSSGSNTTNACINAPITPIIYTTTKATGATFSGLPTGVTGSWSANVVTISGTPTQLGTYNYTVTLTGGCATTTTTATGSIVVNPIITPSVSISSPIICAGVTPTFIATPTNGGAAPIYQWKVNGTIVGTNSDTYTPVSPNFLVNGDVVTVEMTSSASCVSVSTVTSNVVTITINPILAASVSITASAITICAGTSVTFTAIPTNGGSTPTYQWKKNGTNVGTNSSTYSSTSLANGDVVTVVMTSNASPCLSGSPATSNAISMTVNPVLTASVSITASATTICAGTSVTFTATPTNGGTSPIYEWRVNGITLIDSSAPTFTTTLVNGDVVTVVMTSNASPCLLGSPTTSNAILMTVNPILVASVSITASASTICLGTNVTFTATPINGGSTPTYQWKKNGTNVGTNSSTYSSTTLANGDVITAVMTSNASPCLSSSPATSNAITMTVNPNLPASVSIAASTTTICAGTSVTFTATPTNGGSTPTYQWKVNGTNVGTNSPTYTSTSLVNNDNVKVVMNSNASPCSTGSPATSNTVVMTVTSYLSVSVSITASKTTICAGASVTFTATPTNGGSNPTYQWRVNGTNVGTNSTTYTSTTLANGDVVTVEMTSNASSCLTGSPATSNAITMTVNPVLSVTLASNSGPENQTICLGSPITPIIYNVTGVGISVLGTLPNGITRTFVNNVITISGTPTAAFTTTSYPVGIASSCSNSTKYMVLTVNALLVPSVGIAASTSGAICSGTSVTFTATPSNGGSAPTYQWQVNGTDVVGATASTFNTNSIANNDVVTVIMTCGGTLPSSCLTSTSTTSNSITMIVNSTATATITNDNNLICPGSNAVFNISGTSAAVVEYKINSGSTSNVTLIGGVATITVNNPVGDQTLTLVSVMANGCTTTLGSTYTIGSVTTTYDNGTWSNGDPNSYKTVVFNSNYTISSDFYACAIYVASSAVVTVASGNNVYINGEINVASGGNFILNNNSNLLQENSSAINSGAITVKRNSSPIIRLDHTLWSSPVVGQKLFSFSPATLTNRFYSFDSPTNTWINNSNNLTVFDVNSVFSATNGYAIRAPNNYSSTVSSEWTGTFVGVPNNGTKQFQLAYSPDAANYNLVGNPFPSTIDADTFCTANVSKIDGTIYFYQHTLKMDANGIFPAGTNYSCWNSTGYALATAGALNLTPNVIPNGIIQVGQGFFVKSKASGNIVFTNDMRVGDQSHQFLKTTNTTEKHRLWLNLVTGAGVDINQILVGYITNASQDFDSRYDGLLYGNTGSYLYSIVNTNKLAIQGRALPFNSNDEVPLGFNCATAGTFSIRLTDMDGLFSGNQDVFIRDNLMGTDTNIKNAPYTFTSNVGVFENRFKIVYSQALGVSSNTFKDNSVIVYKNSDWFHVSTNGIVMKDIMVYDVSGRLIYKLNDIDDTTAVLKGLSETKQVLFVKVISQENQSVTIKVIN